MRRCGGDAADCRMPKRTYLDSNVLVAAWRGKDQAGTKAMEVLDDPGRALVVSDAVRLEVMPKPLYERQEGESAFYEAIFAQAERAAWHLPTLQQAHELAQRHGIAAMDAIHVATAIACHVDELVSAEKPTKPMFRITEIPVRSLRGPTP